MKKTVSFTLLMLTIILFLLIHPLSSQDMPLFSLLKPNQTGINFRNDIKDSKEHNILIYSNYYGGAGVGIGDINADGLPDIYFAGNLVSDRLYLNKGNLQFEDISKSAGILQDGNWSTSVLMGDVNHDGLLDIYVTCELYDNRPDLRTNRLYINQGNAQFAEMAKEYGVDDNQRTRSACFLDYNKDGQLDLLLLNQPPNPGDYSVFYNTELLIDEYRIRLFKQENGKFVDVSEEAGIDRTGFPNSVAASDLNGDGWTDLYISNDFDVGDWYFINNGDGTFSEKIKEKTRHTSYFSMGVESGDINNDLKPDVLVLDMVAEDNYRLKANMSGMNPEAFWDVVAKGGHYQYMFNMLHLNTYQGDFSDIAQLAGVATTDWSWSGLMADFDNDGWKDIHITNGLMRDIRNNDANKEFKEFIESSLHKYLTDHPNPPSDVTIWDIVDIDKTMKLVPSQKLKNYAFKNNGDLTFTKVIEDWGFYQATFSHGSAYADLDNDGDLDLVVNNVNDPAFIYRNNLNEQKSVNYFRVRPEADGEGIVNLGTKVEIKTELGNQLYEISIMRGMYSTSENIAHFGLGDQIKVDELKITWPDGKISIYHDLPVNQTFVAPYSQAEDKADQRHVQNPIFHKCPSMPINYIHQENEYDDYTTQVLLPYKMSTFGPSMAKGDVNGDHLEDLFLGASATQPAKLFIQQEDGSFTTSSDSTFIVDKKYEDIDACFVDVDNDGDLDLYAVSGGNEYRPSSNSYQDRLYLNDGAGNFSRSESWLPDFIISGSKVRPQDYDDDGDIDLFVGGRHVPWAYPEPATSILLRNEGDHFSIASEQAPEFDKLGMVNDARWLDYNADGKPDLVVVGEWMNVTIFENNGNQFNKVSIPSLSETTGWWFSVAVEDIDQDGDQDIIGGNLGLNYKYKATPTEPFEVFYDDFDQNGSKDIVLSYYNDGTLYPLRGRQCSSEQVPMLKDKFKNYDLFASTDVFGVYGEKNLDQALHYQAKTFASVYFENKGDGEFEAHPLPQMAQLSSVNSILTGDFNNDHKIDLLLAGNLYNAEVETTRNDAGFGLLLLGDGEGHFTAQLPEESGFYVPQQIRKLSEIEIGGEHHILAISNNDQIQLFRYEPLSSHDMIDKKYEP